MDIQEKVIGIFGLIGIIHSIGSMYILKGVYIDVVINYILAGELILSLFFIGIFIYNIGGNK